MFRLTTKAQSCSYFSGHNTQIHSKTPFFFCFSTAWELNISEQPCHWLGISNSQEGDFKSKLVGRIVYKASSKLLLTDNNYQSYQSSTNKTNWKLLEKDCVDWKLALACWALAKNHCQLKHQRCVYIEIRRTDVLLIRYANVFSLKRKKRKS